MISIGKNTGKLPKQTDAQRFHGFDHCPGGRPSGLQHLWTK
jgi:hypothetical protein